jgi:hypothetical protein
MRHLLIVALSMLSVTASQAEPVCQMEYLDAEDLAIMASVQPMPAARGETLLARVEPSNVLCGLVDYFGRVSDDDLSQMQSVRPEGATMAYCLSGKPAESL